MKNVNRIKRLVKSDCAGYFSGNDYCCSKDGTCVFFEETEQLPCCIYFEEGVLPLDVDLEFEYSQERQTDVSKNRKAKPIVKCQRCFMAFDANSNRQHYCENCKKINNREKAKLRKRKSREKGCGVTI